MSYGAGESGQVTCRLGESRLMASSRRATIFFCLFLLAVEVLSSSRQARVCRFTVLASLNVCVFSYPARINSQVR